MSEQILTRTKNNVASLERALSYVLSAGVGVSLLLLAAGLSIGLVQHPELRGDVTRTRELIAREALHAGDLSSVVAGAKRGDGESLVSLGLVLLIATPAVRVLVTLIAFAVRRDAVFSAMTCLVLAIMALSFVLGRST